jgi:nicotinamidase/pyrazinamidase
MGPKDRPESQANHEQHLLDEALEESFPASDPPALTEPGGGIEGRPDSLRAGDALLLVDVQRDFCPGGSLPIEEGDAVVPVLNAWIEAAQSAGVPIVASRDWHPPGHMSFAPSGGPWPVHCVQGTEGASFHPDLNVPAEAAVLSKGDRLDKDAYSAFDGTDLANRLRSLGVKRVWIGGLAQDVCVRATALDAVAAGFDTRLILAATKPVTAAGGEAALAEMRRAGVTVVE